MEEVTTYMVLIILQIEHRLVRNLQQLRILEVKLLEALMQVLKYTDTCVSALL